MISIRKQTSKISEVFSRNCLETFLSLSNNKAKHYNKIPWQYTEYASGFYKKKWVFSLYLFFYYTMHHECILPPSIPPNSHSTYPISQSHSFQKRAVLPGISIKHWMTCFPRDLSQLSAVPYMGHKRAEEQCNSFFFRSEETRHLNFHQMLLLNPNITVYHFYLFTFYI